MPKIEKHGNQYRCRVSTGEKTPSGTYKYIILTAPTERELKRKLLDFEENRERVAEEQSAGAITLEHAMDNYIATCTAAKRSPGTIREYIRMRNTDYSILKRRRISQITRNDLQTQVNQWSAEGLSPKTIRNKLCFITGAMRQSGVLPPTSGIKLPEKEQKEMIIPQDDDVQKAIFYLHGRDTQMYLAVVLASTLGLRRGEICALSMDDFDFENNQVTISKSMIMDSNSQWQIKAPKTRAGRRVLPLSHLIIAAVRECGNTSGSLTGLTPNALTRRYERLRDAIEIPGRFHDLRHYRASVLGALGVPLKYAQTFMGHASMDMINRVYFHTLDRKQQQLNSIISDHDETILNGGSFDYKKQLL